MKTRMNNSNRAWTLAGVALLAGVSPAFADFNFPDFTTTPGLTLAGSATLTGNTIAVTPSTDNTAGGVWYTAGKQMVAGGFDTDFKIRVFDRHGAGADGFAFVVQNSPNPSPLGGQGGAIGYGDNTWYGQTGIPNSLAVEVDLWNNTDRGWDDFGNLPKHVSIQTRGLQPNSPDQSASLGAAGINDLGDGEVHDIHVVYVSGQMNIYVDGALTLSVAVDLSSTLSLDNGAGWVGITAATGAPSDEEGHELRSWSFTGTNIPAPSAAAIMGLGGLVAGRRRRA